MFASEGGHEGCVRLLIAAGANVEHQNKVCDCECGDGTGKVVWLCIKR